MNKLNVLNVSDANKFAFIKGNRPTDEKILRFQQLIATSLSKVTTK